MTLNTASSSAFRAVICLIAVLGFLRDLAAMEEAAPQSDRPHIVIFVSDDMGWNDVGYHGSKIQTPNIDRLAAEGIQLDRFYVHPICSPTRTAMMTGRSPARFGITRPLGGGEGVPLDEHFMPESFQEAGYQTFMVGKWHLGAEREEYSPQARGFDHFYGCRGGMIDYYTHIGQGKLDWQRNGKPLEEQGYSTDLFAAEAVKLIKNRNRSKPVFLYMPFNAPHGPMQAPEDLIRKYATEGGRGRSGGYAAAIDSMDQAIGKVLNTLEQEGMTEDTLVLFFCDNGAKSRGKKSGNSTGLALRGGKGELLEGGVRVPAVLCWPRVIQPGARCEQMISVMDLLPTLTAAAGIEHGNDKPLDGFNVWPVIKLNKEIQRNPVVIAGQRGEFAILQDPLKLIHSADEPRLYNVREDPTESRDLAQKQPEDVARLESALAPFTKLGTQRPRRRRARPNGSPGKGRPPKQRSR